MLRVHTLNKAESVEVNMAECDSEMYGASFAPIPTLLKVKDWYRF